MSAHDGAGLHVQLLGQPCWRVPDGRTDLLKHKQAALLAYVAVHGEEESERVAARLWSGVPAMQQALSVMRKEVPHKVLNQGHMLRLLPDVHCDIFEDLSRWPTQALLDRCVFLDGISVPLAMNAWLAAQREHWLAQVCKALLLRAAELEQSNALAPALRVARRLTEMAPKNEDGWRTRMWLHFIAHDLAAAVQAHEMLLAGLPPGRSPSTETQELWRVVQRAAQAPRLPTGVNAALNRPPQIVGRQPQWAALDAAAALGQPFLLRGEGGIGKSRLLGSFFARLGPSIIVKALCGERDSPYATLATLLRELDAQYGLRPDNAADRRTLSAVLPHWQPGADAVVADGTRLRNAVRRLLERAVAAREVRLRCIGIDDLHDADAASLDLWRKLGEGGLGRLPQFGFAASPVTEGPLHAALAGWCGGTPPLKLIDLPPLSCADVAELLPTLALEGPAATVPAELLHAQVGGNPRMLLETLREVPADWAPGQPLPRSGVALALLERRIRNLPERALPLLQLAAVLGPDIGCAAQALGVPACEFDAWRADLAQHHVFIDGRFVHDTMREVALASLSPQQRLHWHAVAARVLQHDPRLPPVRIAAHWEAAAHWPEAGAAFRAAARLADNAGRADEARRLYAQATACFRHAGAAADEFDTLYESLPSALLLEDPRPAQALTDRLAALAATPWQHACLAVAQALLAVSHYARDGAALAVTAHAVALAEGFDDLHCDALALHAAALAQAGRFDEALSASERALALAEAGHWPRKAREIGATRLYVCFELSRITEGLALCRRLMDAYEGAGDEAGAMAMEGHLALLLLTVDTAAAWPVAQRACERHRAIEASASGPMAVMHRMALAAAALHLGRFDVVLPALHERGRFIAEGLVSGIRAKVQLVLAHRWLLLGADVEAVAALDADDSGWPTAMRVQRCWALARAARLRGRDGAGHLQRIGALQAAEPGAPLAHTAWLEWARQGDARAVAAQMLHVQGLYEAAGMAGAARAAALRRIDRLGELDDADAVAAAGDAALALQRQLDAGAGLHASTYLPEAWLLLARVLARAGHAPQAAAARAAGCRWIMEAALPHVPAEWRDSFLQRNPVNRVLLASD